MLHGKGVYSWPDGRKYDGEYQDDMKHGLGTYTWPDGKKYVGGWFESKQHGEATIYNTKGQSKSGLWENGERVKWFSTKTKRNMENQKESSVMIDGYSEGQV